MTSSLSYSFDGHSLEVSFQVPAENIARANALYYQQLRQIQALEQVSALRQKQYLNLKLSHSLCREQVAINQEIIHAQSAQIEQYQLIGKNQKRIVRVLISTTVLLSTYILLQ